MEAETKRPVSEWSDDELQERIAAEKGYCAFGKIAGVFGGKLYGLAGEHACQNQPIPDYPRDPIAAMGLLKELIIAAQPEGDTMHISLWLLCFYGGANVNMAVQVDFSDDIRSKCPTLERAIAECWYLAYEAGLLKENTNG